MSREKNSNSENNLKQLLLKLDDLGVPYHGRGVKIAEVSGYSRGLVSDVLNGNKNCTARFFKLAMDGLSQCEFTEKPSRVIDRTNVLNEPSTFPGALETIKQFVGSVRSDDIIRVPVYSAHGSCGSGVMNHDAHIESWLSFTVEYARSAFGSIDQGLCCIKAAGDSMTPTIQPGDTVVLNRNENTFDRDGAIYVLQRGETTLIKRLHQLRGKLRVASDNLEKGTTEDMTAEELSADGYIIVGRVVYIGKLV